MDIDFKKLARDTYKTLKERISLPGWQGYHDVHSLSVIERALRYQIDKAGEGSAILDESGQASSAEIDNVIKALFERYHLKYIQLVEPRLDDKHVSKTFDLDAMLHGISSLRTAFARSGAAAAHIDPIKFEQRLANAESRFRQESAKLQL